MMILLIKIIYQRATSHHEKLSGMEAYFNFERLLTINISYLRGKKASQDKNIARGLKMKPATAAKNPNIIVSGMKGKIKRLAKGEMSDN